MPEAKYQTRDVYMVVVDGRPRPFDMVNDAIAHVRLALQNAGIDAKNQSAETFEGMVHWYIDQEPATPLDRLLDLYGELHDEDGDAGVDRDDPFLMVEWNCRGGYWLTSGTSPSDLADGHYSQEYAEDWELEGIFDTRTGEQVHGTAEVSY